MASNRFRTARYTRAWITGRHRSVEEEVRLERDGTAVAASLVRPDGRRRPFPAWVVLHGITRRGREHAQLARFTHAVVSTGAVAIVPEVPEWQALSLAPGLAIPTIRAGVAGLRSSGWARDAPVGVIGFSFGAPHAVSATAHPDLRDDLAGAVSFGGYCDLARTVRFLMTGTHEWQDHVYRLTPDPYGRWIIAANYLTSIEAHRDAHDVTRALRSLAQKAGDLGVPSLSPQLDPYKAELRAGIADERVALFDLFAPGSVILPDLERGTRMAEALVDAAVRAEPEIDPHAALAEVQHPVHLLHGRRDHLIPFSESLRMREALPEGTPAQTTITRLFGHSAQDSFPSFLKAVREVPVFLSALRKVLRLV
jgi:dienelactone hydrolase